MKPIDRAAPSPEPFIDRRRCRIRDCSALEGFRPDIRRHGFEAVDLSRLDRLQTLLEGVRAAKTIAPAEARDIRRELRGRRFPLACGRRLRILYIAPEGFILRVAGPNGAKPDLPPDAENQGAALTVHADQDVDGTPVRQILRGLGPWLFRHESPRGSNRFSPVFLLNLWIPLDQITQPLALMDQQTLDRRRHQLHYALETEGILSREEDRRINDIWSFLHDESQQWYFTSEMTSRNGYLFNTLGTPHGAMAVPGEDLAEAYHRRLGRLIALMERGDRATADRLGEEEAPELAPERLAEMPGSLARALVEIRGAISEAATRMTGPWTESARKAGIARLKEARSRLERKSLEMRLVAVLTP